VNRGKGILIILLMLMVGTAIAQVSIDNRLEPNQTDYKTEVEKELTTKELTLSDCTPILVNNKGSYVFDTDGTGCPTGTFEINEGELLLKIISMENRIDDLNAELQAHLAVRP